MRSQTYLTPQDVAQWPVTQNPAHFSESGAALSAALARHGQGGPNQVAGSHWMMGCVALEITQRCNLDCTLCYLSEQSEAVHDLPMAEIQRRIEAIYTHYGPGTNVQITGGDPTLRPLDELEQIVRWIADKQMRSALFTNGIKASRDMLKRLAVAGLKDVAFHVDMTQKRKGFESEAALNAVREDYIGRAKGLGLHILFNTTVFDGNIDDVPMLAAFFADRAREVHLASFQMQAETGRGVLGARGRAISLDSVRSAIGQGIGVPLSFSHPKVGHDQCNRYAGVLVAGAARTAIFDDAPFFARMFALGMAATFDRYDYRRGARAFAKQLLSAPGDMFAAARYALRKVWALRIGLLQSWGRVHKLTFYMHNFMDAAALDKARCESCVFMAMTRDGPVSMCIHNARRDDFILQTVAHGNEDERWNPLSGCLDAASQVAAPLASIPLKKSKGRTRAAFMASRQ